MRATILLGVAALFCAPLLVAGNDAAYPKEKIAQFVVEKLDVTSLPSSLRPQKKKGKKTFADYGITAQSVGENEAVVEEAGGARTLGIKVLEGNSSGLYVCFSETGQNGAETKTQSVVFLKRKDPNALLKGRESFREFSACPMIGGSDSAADSYNGDGD